MSFPDSVRTNVLIKCKRHCCLCGKHAGIYMELHHIRQKANGGDDTEENCMPLCLKCHGEVRSYNPNHPIGLKYKESELILRRNEVYEAVKNKVVSNYSEEDISKAKKLLDEYYKLLENIIGTDPCGQPIDILSVAWAEDMSQALKSYGYTFVDEELDREKLNLIDAITEWHTLLCNESYFHLMNEHYLCFNSITVNEYREIMLNIRTNVYISYSLLRNAVAQRTL